MSPNHKFPYLAAIDMYLTCERCNYRYYELYKMAEVIINERQIERSYYRVEDVLNELLPCDEMIMRSIIY